MIPSYKHKHTQAVIQQADRISNNSATFWQRKAEISIRLMKDYVIN